MDFVQAKSSVGYGFYSWILLQDLVFGFCPKNPQRKAGEEKKNINTTCIIYEVEVLVEAV